MAKRTALAIGIPLAALVAGFLNAWLAAGVHSLFFILLPLLAFAFGYSTGWRRGLLYGVLLFLGHTFSLLLVCYGPDAYHLLYPFPYLYAFIVGGLGFPLIGALAPRVRGHIRSFKSMGILLLLAVLVGGCAWFAVPHVGFSYRVVLSSTLPLENVELYLPVGTIDDEPYEVLYDEHYGLPGDILDSHLTRDFTHDIVETGNGTMLKLTVPSLHKDSASSPWYTASFIWNMDTAPGVLRLAPRLNVLEVQAPTFERTVGPVKGSEELVTERFDVPVKFIADTPGTLTLTIWNTTNRHASLHFGFSKTYPYTEYLKVIDAAVTGRDGQSDDGWLLVPVKATVTTTVNAVGD